MDDGAVERARLAIEAAYPEYAYPYFLRLGIPAEFQRQAEAARP